MPPLRPWVQPDLFGGPEVVCEPRKRQKKTPATVTSSPGAMTGSISKGKTDAQKCSGLLVRGQAIKD